jgi:hypothetical protein
MLRRTLAKRLRTQGLSLQEIGRAIGRDYTTVHHLLRTRGDASAHLTPAPKVEPDPPAPDHAAVRILQALDQLQRPQREAVEVLVEALARADRLERELAGYRSAARRVQRRVQQALHTDTIEGAGVREAG